MQRTLSYMLIYILKNKKAQVCAQTETTWTHCAKKRVQRFGTGGSGSDSYLIAVSCSYLTRRLFPDRFRGHKLSFPSMARLRWRGRLSFIQLRCCAESSLKCSPRGIPLLRLRDAPTNGKSGERKRGKKKRDFNQKQLMIPKSAKSKYPRVKGKKRNDGESGPD